MTPLRTSPGCTDALAKGWVVEVRGVRCRVLGRCPGDRWRLERMDTPTRETFTLARGAEEMRKVEASLAGRGLLR
jgi:hypothetical protein